jgi:hypothetical protein
MGSKRRFQLRLSSWGVISVFAVLALICLAQSVYLRSFGSQQRGVAGAVVCGSLVLIGLFLKYRDWRKARLQEETESKP